MVYADPLTLVRSGTCVFGHVERHLLPDVEAVNRQLGGLAAKFGQVRLRIAEDPFRPRSLPEVVAVIATGCTVDDRAFLAALLPLLPVSKVHWLYNPHSPHAIALLNWGRRLKRA